jgi:hypothetical protein
MKHSKSLKNPYNVRMYDIFVNDSSTLQWIEAIIEENFKPCNLDERARSVVKSLLTKYNARLVNDSLRKAVRQAKGLARQENKPVCEYLQDALDKDWLTQICEGYANPMID